MTGSSKQFSEGLVSRKFLLITPILRSNTSGKRDTAVFNNKYRKIPNSKSRLIWSGQKKPYCKTFVNLRIKLK